MAKPGAGKSFETEVGKACKLLNAWDWSSNSQISPCDRLAAIPCRVLHNGEPVGPVFALAAILEAKECAPGKEEAVKHRFSLTRISTNERKHLDSHANKGSLAAVLLKDCSYSKPRYFAMHWNAWRVMEDEIGFVVDSPARRKAGTASISLIDGSRHPCMLELGPIRRPGGLGEVLDLLPLLPEGLRLASPGERFAQLGVAS